MTKYRLKLKKLGKKTLIQLIKRLRQEAARLHGAIDRIKEHNKELQEKYEELQADSRQVLILSDEVSLLRQQIAKPVEPNPQALEELQENYEALQADFAAVTDGMSGQEIAQQIQESKDFSLEEEEEIGWVITYTEDGRPEQHITELVASSPEAAKSKFLETKEYADKICREAQPEIFSSKQHVYEVISVEPKEVEEA